MSQEGRQLEGQVVAVTGAFGALGSAVVKAALAEGAQVAAIDRAPAPRTPLEGAALFGDVDLAGDAGARAAVDGIIARFGRLDALVNIAGGFRWEQLADGSLDTWNSLYELNLRTAVAACRAALPHLPSGHGRIVNIGAAGAQKAGAGMGAYAASKAGVARLTEALAEELKDRGITVNAVLPSSSTRRRIAPTCRRRFHALGAADAARRRDRVPAVGARAGDHRRAAAGHRPGIELRPQRLAPLELEALRLRQRHDHLHDRHRRRVLEVAQGYQRARFGLAVRGCSRSAPPAFPRRDQVGHELHAPAPGGKPFELHARHRGQRAPCSPRWDGEPPGCSHCATALRCTPDQGRQLLLREVGVAARLAHAIGGDLHECERRQPPPTCPVSLYRHCLGALWRLPPSALLSAGAPSRWLSRRVRAP
jgi:NAD(P)-dependent dehydrogenase (short-subunit alcohol dehydrogenase family)